MNIRRLPAYAGACLRALLAGRPRALLKLMAKSPYTVKDLPQFGASMLVDVRDPAISKPILVLGEYEPHFTRVLLSLTDAGTKFLDVGANIGFFTLIVAARATKGRVWSIEPDPDNVRLLRANVALNGFEDRVSVWQGAASDTADGDVYFSTLGYSANLGARFTARSEDILLARSLPGAPAPVLVPATTADSLLRGERVDLVKVDVEGHEPAVFAGMRRILEEDRPAILSEFAPGTIEHISKTDPLDFLRAVAAHRYVFALIEGSGAGKVTPLAQHAEAVLERFDAQGGHHVDLLLLPEEKAGAALERIGCGGEK